MVRVGEGGGLEEGCQIGLSTFVGSNVEPSIIWEVFDASIFVLMTFDVK